MAPSSKHIWHLGIVTYIEPSAAAACAWIIFFSIYICRCGYNQQSSSVNSPSPTDGVLGLGRGKSSIVSQLGELGLTRNVVGHCFSGQGGGYLFFGDGFVPFSSVTWTPMSRDPLL